MILPHDIHFQILTILVLYRMCPTPIQIISGTLFFPEVLRRGFLTQFQDMAPAIQERSREVYARWARRNLRFLRSPILVWLNNEVLLVYPWLWPLWIGPDIAIQHRCTRAAMDNYWRDRT